MSRPADISPELWERADILRDQFSHIEDDTEYTARILQAAEAAPVGLAEAHAQTLAFISTFIADNGYSPSLEQIQHGLALSSKSIVHRRVQQLIARGVLRKDGRRPHSLAVVGRAA